MNHEALEKKLLAAARGQAREERVPYAFEQRVMAVVRSRGVADGWAIWGQALWRAAAPCMALAVVLGAWSWMAPSASPAGDWSQEFENTLLAVADQDTSAEVIR
jgi:hypothetical protein